MSGVPRGQERYSSPRFQFTTTKEVAERVRRLHEGGLHGLSISAVIERLVCEGLDRLERQRRMEQMQAMALPTMPTDPDGLIKQGL